MVYVTAAVTGAKKAPALDLKVENFQVLEDKVEQKVTFFAPPDGFGISTSSSPTANSCPAVQTALPRQFAMPWIRSRKPAILRTR
jgi:hypothetical protein